MKGLKPSLPEILPGSALCHSIPDGMNTVLVYCYKGGIQTNMPMSTGRLPSQLATNAKENAESGQRAKRDWAVDRVCPKS